MRKWIVVTPEYGVLIPITDEGYGPTEWGCDVIEIEAEYKRDAIVLGVQLMLHGGKGGHGEGERYRYCLDQRSDHASPYTGVKAYLSSEECIVCEGYGNTDAHPHEICNLCQGTGLGSNKT